MAKTKSKSKRSKAEQEEDHLDTSINPYKVLGLDDKDKGSIETSHVKSAYRRAALIWHPDKVAQDKQEEAHEKFQEIALAYSVLVDPSRRAHYDATGSISEANDNFNWKEFFDDLYKTPISKEILQEDKELYRSSGEEYDDIIKWYKKSKGDIDVIFENVLHSEILDDYDRFVDIINDAIDKGDIAATSKWESESQEKKKARLKKAKREAKASEKLSKKLGLSEINNNDDNDEQLAALIKKKSEDRYQNMITALEDKYVNKPSPSGKNPKRKAVSASSSSTPPKKKKV